MATCPECWNKKPFFAPRCTSCNQPISFFVQLIFSTIATTLTVGGFVLIVWGIAKIIG